MNRLAHDDATPWWLASTASGGGSEWCWAWSWGKGSIGSMSLVNIKAQILIDEWALLDISAVCESLSGTPELIRGKLLSRVRCRVQATLAAHGTA